MYQPTAQDFRIIQQRIQDVYLKIEVFDYEDFLKDDFTDPQTILEGKIISDNYSFDVDSDIRRTYNITLSVSSEYDMFNIEKVFWLNRILKITCGTYDLEKSQKIEYNLGIYTFTNFIYTIDQSAYTVQINCVDLVAFLNGQVNGQLPAIGTTIPAYDTIETYGEFDIKYDDNDNTISYYWVTKEVFNDIIEAYDGVNINNWDEYNQFLNLYDTQHYDIYDGTVSTFEDTKGHWINSKYCYWWHTVQEVLCDLLRGLGYTESKYINTISMDPINTIPYDLEFGTGATYWELFVGLRDLFPAYEIYFDVNGRFIYKKIPIDVDEENVLEKENFKSIIINESLNENVANVRNVTRIWGQTIDADTYITANSGVSSNSNYTYVVTNNAKAKVPFVLEAPATTNFSNVFYYINNRKYGCGSNTGLTQFTLGKYYYVENIRYNIMPAYVNSPIKNIAVSSNQVTFSFNYTTSDDYIYCFFVMNQTIQNIINRVTIKWNSNSNSISINKNFYGTNIDNYQQLDSNYFTNNNMYLFRFSTRSSSSTLNITKLTNSNLISVSNAVVIPYTTSDTYTLKDGMSLGITFDNAPTAESYIILNNIPYHFYASSNSLIEYNQLVSNIPYVFDVVNKGNQLQLLGEKQIVAIAKTILEEPSDEEKELDYQKEETRNIVYRVVPNSPFAIETIGELNQVLSGDQYDEIYTTELAKERAEYENWKVARINDNLTINCLMIPWLEGNEKVEYQSQKTNEINEYIIKQISGSVSTWQQSITMQKFYPLYPE